MKALLIQFQLKANGGCQADIAAACHVSPATVSQVVSRTGKSEKVERAIAAALNLPVEDVFPDRYTAGGILKRAARKRVRIDFSELQRHATRMQSAQVAA